jgi:uncharacterized protein YkwD
MQAMKRGFVALALAVCAAAGAAAGSTQEAGEGLSLLGPVQQARSRGCAGHAGTAAPLQWSDALARAAARMARGEPSLTAVEKEGFRATRVFQASLAGFRKDADVADTLAQQYCTAIADPQFTDVGVHRQGASWLIVLAARVRLDELAHPGAVAAKVLALTNEARSRARRCGERQFDAAPPLRTNPRLEKAATLHAQDMAQHQYVEHVGRDGSTFAQRITRAHYGWHSVGENVAAGQRTPEDVVQDWLASPGHCANIMSDEFTEMGVAFSVNMNARPVVYWAQEFGRAK